MSPGPLIALEPEPRHPRLVEAVEAGGGRIVAPGECEAIVWTAPQAPEDLAAALAIAPGARWVQLPFAGIENFAHLLDHDRSWTCGKGVYAEPVAELALTLGLAGLRGLATYARATSWSGPQGDNLLGGAVTVLGGGGITESLVRLLGPFGCRVTVVRRRDDPMPGVDRVLPPDQLHDALAGADLVVLALALTPETDGIIGPDELERMERHAWLVNVARGGHVVTDALVGALRDGMIGGAGLDVTDPEPLPDGHPLWELPNCLLTPHVGNTPEMAIPLLAERIRQNVRRFAAGEPLLGSVDTAAGY